MLDERLVLRVGEGYIRNAYIALHRLRKFDDRISRLRLRFDQLKHACRAGHRVRELREDGRNIVKGLHILVCVGEEHRECSDRQTPAEDHEGADQSDERIDHSIDRTCGRIRQRAEEDRPHGILLEILIDLVETFRSPLAVIERLHDLLAADHFIDEGRLLAAHLGLPLEHREGPPGDKPRDEKADRRQDHDHQCNAYTSL